MGIDLRRFAEKGFTQKPGTDFFETFSPTARMKAMRTLIALAAARKKLKFFQLEAASRILGERKRS